MENLEEIVKHLENEVSRLIATLRIDVKRNYDDISNILSYLQYKFPNEWKEDGTILKDQIKREE